MKKYLLLLASFVALSPNVVFAQDNNDKINVLLEEIAVLEKEVEAKKLEVQKLAQGDINDDINWVEVSLDLGKTLGDVKSLSTIIKMGIDYSSPTPELVVVYYNKNIGTEKMPPHFGLEGLVYLETEEKLDYITPTENLTYLIIDGDDFIEGDRYSLPDKIGTGWEGYFKSTFKLKDPDPNAQYFFTYADSNHNYVNVTVLNTEEPLGTVVQKEN